MATEIQPQAGVSDAAVRKATGEGWTHWYAALDDVGAKDWDHKRRAAWLKEQSTVSAWWAQQITVAYEQARGLRDVHQKADGYAASASKTFAVSVEDLYAAWQEAARSHWCDAALRERTCQPNKSMRFDCGGEGERVQAYFTDKGVAKSSVSVQHERLADADAVTVTKAAWKQRLQHLSAFLSR